MDTRWAWALDFALAAMSELKRTVEGYDGEEEEEEEEEEPPPATDLP